MCHFSRHVLILLGYFKKKVVTKTYMEKTKETSIIEQRLNICSK